MNIQKLTPIEREEIEYQEMNREGKAGLVLGCVFSLVILTGFLFAVIGIYKFLSP